VISKIIGVDVSVSCPYVCLIIRHVGMSLSKSLSRKLVWVTEDSKNRELQAV